MKTRTVRQRMADAVGHAFENREAMLEALAGFDGGPDIAKQAVACRILELAARSLHPFTDEGAKMIVRLRDGFR